RAGSRDCPWSQSAQRLRSEPAAVNRVLFLFERGGVGAGDSGVCFLGAGPERDRAVRECLLAIPHLLEERILRRVLLERFLCRLAELLEVGVRGGMNLDAVLLGQLLERLAVLDNAIGVC